VWSSKKYSEMQARLEALDRVQAVIEFDLAGNVLTANQNFLTTLGYSLGEIVGTHHSRFVPQGYEATPEYKAFWDRLRAGEFQAGQFMRIGKSGKEVWIEASYNPVLGKNGQPNKIIKFATDISRQKTEDAERAGLVEAVRKVQAVIEFTLEGMILNALWLLLGDTGARAEVLARPELVAAVVEESLRMEPAAAVVDRYATRDVTVAGTAIPRGSLVEVSLTGANRDPAEFPDPDHFDLHRPNARRHLAFAAGPHVCIGMDLARLETRIAVATLLADRPHVRLGAGAPAPTGLVFRKPARLPVTG